MVATEIPDGFAHEYDLDALHLATPRGHGFHMYITPRYREHYESRSYEPFTADLLSCILRRAGLFVDIGANYGFFSLLAHSQNPTLDIIAVEPTPITFAVLARNAKLSGTSNIAVHELAVSDRAGRANFNVSTASDNCGFYDHPNAATLRVIEVETTTIDAMLDSREPCPLVIKIDTEGHELAVLRGMSRTLDRFPDVKLIVEYNPTTLRAAGGRPEDLLRHLDLLGFEMHALEEQQRHFYRVTPDAEWARRFGNRYANLYCVRRSRALSVCFVSHSSGLFGAERYLLELIEELVSEYGVVCSVVLPGQGPLAAALEKVGAARIIVKYRWWCSWPSARSTATNSSFVRNAIGSLWRRWDRIKLFRRMRKSIKSFERGAMPAIMRLDPDVVWTQSMVVPWGAMAAARMDKPHVWYVMEFGELDHGLIFCSPLHAITADVLNSSDLVYVPSKIVGETLFPNAAHERVRVLYCHIPSPRPAPNGPAKLGIFKISGAVKIGIFSGISRNKGQEDIVRAVARLSARGHNVELLVASIGNADYLRYLVEIVSEHGIAERVKFSGFLNDVYPAMREIDIAVACSRAEAFGRVGVEAMLCSKPVVYPNAGGFVEYMVEGKTGFSYTPGDVDGLVDRLERLIGDPLLRSEMGSFGRSHAVALFSKDNFSGEAYRTMQKLCRDGRTARGMPKAIEKLLGRRTFNRTRA